MNLADKINQPVFHHVGNVADSLSRPCYVVGGYVRDIFLHRHSKDIDFVTVGSGIEVAEAVAATRQRVSGPCVPQLRHSTGKAPRPRT